MKIAFFDAKSYDKKYFDLVNKGEHEIVYFEENLNINNVNLAEGFDAVCCFVNTFGDKYILELLSQLGVKVWLQRSMGYNKVDLFAAKELGINVFRVPNYSAESVSEFAVTLLMTLNRNVNKAIERVKQYNFNLDGLDGKSIIGSTVGVIGAGKIGQGFIRALKGMGARVLVYDAYSEQNLPNLAIELGFEYAPFTKILRESDFISLHAPSLPSTKYIIDKDAVNLMKKDVVIVNTARGDLVDIKAILYGLENNIIRGFGADVLDREEGRFYEDISKNAFEYKQQDPEWQKLIEDNRVIITSHQAFLTDVALGQIAKITLSNASNAENGNFEGALTLLDDGRVLNG
ncbi:D-lactate dehydrogenase [Mycoplasmopsis maculosa]|uniref:D-lactate dehydrogenase n=1 Tax=Mycoplasmopsis maculosa TaxID=114885 RepID=A0A449B3P4_9BACT|nr:2-hydroxyacid dehydrogenase [Mycoplasmopsis maculosa]VEU75206.1 D-lactate dehydrogenase [Mycoplasmopsis maculosa]